jgi:hypothetical protein
MLSALVLTLSLGLAAEPLVQEGPTASAVARVAADAGLNEWELQPVQLQSLLPRSGVVLLGADQPSACPNPTLSNSSLRDTVGLAEKQILYHQEWDAARLGLELAAQGMACLAEPLEASMAARVFFLRGFLELETGNEDAARSAFERAVAFAPGLEWDERFPPDGEPLLQELIKINSQTLPENLTLGHGLRMVPTLWLDGQPAKVKAGQLDIKPGYHLVQMLQPNVVTLPVHIGGESPLAIVKAQSMAEAPLASLQGTPELAALLEQEFGAGTRVWVFAGENTWLLENEWSELPKSDAVLHAERAIVGSKLTRSGLGILGAGLVGGAVSWTIIGSNYRSHDGETRASYEARQARVDATTPWAYATSGIALSGLAVSVTGWALLDGRLHIGPALGPGLNLRGSL